MNLTPKQTIKGKVAEAQSLKGTMKDIPSVDNTLTKEGYAADAKAVGDALNTKAPISHTEDKGNPHGVTAEQVGARPDTWMPSASEIGARPDTWTPTAEEVGARPNTWTPSAQEVGARPNTWMPTAEDVGAATPTEVSNAVKKANPVNLLDNSDFRNPVNQRGVTALTGRGIYTVDRWMIDSSNGNGYWDLKPGIGIGLNVNGDSWMVFVQKVDGLDRAKQYTIAFKDGNGNNHINESADIQWYDNYAEVRIILNSGTRTVVWAALYEGEYTAETIPEYHPKGYAHELLECQRYCTVISGSVNARYGVGVTDVANAYICVPIPTKMRMNPSLTFSGSFIVWNGGAVIPVTGMYIDSVSNNTIHLGVNASGVTKNQVYQLVDGGNGDSKLIFSADL